MNDNERTMASIGGGSMKYDDVGDYDMERTREHHGGQSEAQRTTWVKGSQGEPLWVRRQLARLEGRPLPRG